MARLSYRRRWKFLVVVVCLTAVAGALAASGAATGRPAIRSPFRVLQMNLCDSGIARCYTGRSVTEAAAAIRTGNPDVVTLNEVCQDDVHVLKRALMAASHGGVVVSAFKAAIDRSTASEFRCRNGQPYGIGVLAHVPGSHSGYTTYSGMYPTQDPSDPEERVWLCLHPIGSFYSCTTQLANTSRTVALAQCGYLLQTAIPAVRARDGGYQSTVLGADLNLGYDGPPDIRSCVPSGYLHKGDGGVQYVVATIDFALSSDRSIGMDGTTDHPGLLVALTTSDGGAGP
jgi:Endonuclease/Exonuclease/phosphatase family